VAGALIILPPKRALLTFDDSSLWLQGLLAIEHKPISFEPNWTHSFPLLSTSTPFLPKRLRGHDDTRIYPLPIAPTTSSSTSNYSPVEVAKQAERIFV